MDSPHDDLPHPNKLQSAAYYLLGSVILGSGIYFLVQGVSLIIQ